ncbi:CPBP family intramembrane metalloprotease [Myroides odoratimimus]|uniref:CPBP family glutamic-type intramembrane protease n=1 Tax=Myroides odoratimimus TaxID=76832 RepID=UPI002576752D|nr:CPBP family glutamic-type intramembrane protease [Myroides odoratimimus]MDM1395956.1 CPBP family intramembrane metalloprotease [Myroides odoratimimus]
MSISVIISDFIHYIRQPHTEVLDISKKEKVRRSLVLVVFTLIVITVYIFSINKIVPLPKTARLFDFIADKGLLVAVLFIVLLGPLAEEVAFRLALRFKSWYLLLSTPLTLVYSLWILYRINLSIAFIVGGVFYVILCTYLYLHRNNIVILKERHEKYFGYVFYSYTFLFMIMHISNFYTINTEVLVYSPLLFLPQFIGGLLLGYIRMRFGFGYNCMIHIIYNTIPMLLLYVTGVIK